MDFFPLYLSTAYFHVKGNTGHLVATSVGDSMTLLKPCILMQRKLQILVTSLTMIFNGLEVITSIVLVSIPHLAVNTC